MTADLIRIGNSRGIRLPKRLLELYRLEEGDSLELEERREGILLKPLARSERKLDWASAYREMAEEVAEATEWSLWDGVSADGLEADD